MINKEKDYTGTIEYHLEVCDEPIDECPIKKAYIKKYGDFGEYAVSE